MNVSWQGVVIVARQEFRLRIRAGKWRWLLAAWFVVLVAFTWLLSLAVGALGAAAGGPESDDAGAIVFGGLMLFMLGLALLVVPALTAQSVNGDRERGTLATLQVTLLSPWEIALGKLASAWVTALVFVVVALPCVGWAVLLGGVPFDRLVVTLGVVALLLGVVCAVGLGLSALLARSTTSSVLTYLTVFALTVGTLVTFSLSLGLTADERMVRPDRVWWLLAPNPFVVLADAAPRADDPPGRFTSVDPLGEIGDAVRAIRRPPQPIDFVATPEQLPDPEPPEPVWPWGLGANVLLGVGAVTLTARQLRTPAGKLARGTRVA